MPIQRFLSQQQFVTWADGGLVDVQGDRVVMVAEKRAFKIREAVRFLKLVSGEDPTGLVSKVKTTQQLKDLGAEHYLDSVILGESAYEVMQGYVAEGERPAPAAAAPAGPSRQGASGEADLLANFILNKMG